MPRKKKQLDEKKLPRNDSGDTESRISANTSEPTYEPDIDGVGVLQPLAKDYGRVFRDMAKVILVSGVLFESLYLWTRAQTTSIELPAKVIAGLFVSVLVYIPIWAYLFNRTLIAFYPTLRNFVSASSSALHTWFDREMRVLFHTRGLILSGVAVVIAGILFLSLLIHNLTLTEQILLYAFISAVLFACGMGAYTVYGLNHFFSRIPELKIRVFLNQDSITSVRSLATLIFRITILYAIAGVILALALLLTPFAYNPLIVVWWPVMSTPGLLLLSSQYRIHQEMVSGKTKMLKGFLPHLRQAFNEINENPTPNRLTRFKDVQEVFRQLENLPEWPFDFRTILSVFSSPAASLVFAGVSIIAKYLGFPVP